jgi:hypothetical protein
MSPYEDEGLGISILIYLAAILCVLAAFVVPVFLANGPTVEPNSSAKRTLSLLDARRNDNSFPVAHLKEKAIVSPALLAALNAKAEKTKPSHDRPVHAVRRRDAPRHAPVRRTYADATPQRPVGPFSLFFSLF